MFDKEPWWQDSRKLNGALFGAWIGYKVFNAIDAAIWGLFRGTLRSTLRLSRWYLRK